MQTSILSVAPRGYLPDLSGGLEITLSSTLEHLIDLPACGHVAAASPRKTLRFFIAKLKRKLFGVYRGQHHIGRHIVHTDPWHPLELTKLSEQLKPALIVCHVSGDDEIINSVAKLDLPTIFYIHGCNISSKLLAALSMKHRRFVCESRFISDLASQRLEEYVEIIKPLIDPDSYRVSQRGQEILVVNPHPIKGGYKVVEIARQMPNRQFLVIGGWSHTANDPQVLEVERQLSQLENVHRVAHMADIRKAFRRARCLLMPCLVEEAYGRTAAEALIAGIPVLASNRGALPETVGTGGFTLDPDAPLTDWVAQLETFFSDDEAYNDLVEKALDQALAADRQIDYIKGQLNRLAQELITAGEVHA